MKVIAINGSARKGWNTDLLCQKALEGAKDMGAEIEMIQLNDYTFKGCISCFGCHRKTSMDKISCFYKDELTPVLEKCLEADVIIIGSPIYYGFVMGTVRALMERLLFPLDTYYADEEGHRVVKRKKLVPTAMIYTMNANEYQANHYGMSNNLHNNAGVMKGIFGYCEELCSYDTYQFKDYSQYTNNIFDPEHKKRQWEEQFPKDLENAYALGQRLVKKAEEATELSSN
jgi:multimeric flavodoxin WrbA